MQQVSNPDISTSQKLLNEFQEKSITMLRSNPEIQDSLRELALINHPINGIITITNATKSYIKYMRSHGVKLEKNRPLMTYMSIPQFFKTTQNQLGKDVLLILQRYQNFTAEEKQRKFLFIFQTPYSFDPSQSLKNMIIVEDIFPLK